MLDLVITELFAVRSCCRVCQLAAHLPAECNHRRRRDPKFPSATEPVFSIPSTFIFRQLLGLKSSFILIMHALVRNAASTESALSRATLNLKSTQGRSPAYRRLASQLSQTRHVAPIRQMPAMASPLRSPFLPAELRLPMTSTQQFHVSARRFEAEKPKAEPKPTEEPSEKKADESEAKSEEETKKGEEGEGKEEGKEEGKDEEGKKKEDLPPPPPHGDKTPWQVFTETMNTEFQKSKDWNESTKQIGAAAHQFSESESVRRAREAYEKSTGAVSSTASAAIKGTAGAIGKGAAWTWDTSAMQWVRKGANATGGALDKATKPIRDTDAYKNVKNVIDDGSSSRYGGWTEKEERRKKREAMEAKMGKSGQVMQEDPE